MHQVNPPAITALHIDHHRLAVLRRKRAAELLGISLSTFDRIRAEPANAFPAPIQLGEQAVGWRVGDIDAWLTTRARPTH